MPHCHRICKQAMLMISSPAAPFSLPTARECSTQSLTEILKITVDSKSRKQQSKEQSREKWRKHSTSRRKSTILRRNCVNLQRKYNYSMELYESQQRFNHFSKCTWNLLRKSQKEHFGRNDGNIQHYVWNQQYYDWSVRIHPKTQYATHIDEFQYIFMFLKCSWNLHATAKKMVLNFWIAEYGRTHVKK